MAVPKFYGTYVFYFGRIAQVLTHIKAIFWGEWYIYLLFPSSIWTRKVVKVMCTRETHCTTWTPSLTPPVLIRSVYDRHCHSGTDVYLTCISFICQHKHKIVDKQPFYWRSNINKNPTFTLQKQDLHFISTFYMCCIHLDKNLSPKT